MALTITSEAITGGICVSVAGEVDVSCADELRDVLDQALQSELELVEVSLKDTSYIDSTGIGVLVGAAHRASEDHIAFRVVNPQRNVARVLGMLGLERDLCLTVTTDDKEAEDED